MTMLGHYLYTTHVLDVSIINVTKQEAAKRVDSARSVRCYDMARLITINYVIILFIELVTT